MLRTREPGGTPGAEALRALILHPDRDWPPLAELLLHFAARADHVAGAIRPALEGGKVVVCDRYTDSTMAYQAHAGASQPSQVSQLATFVALDPDLTLVLTASPDVARARRAARDARPGAAPKDTYERRGEAFHQRVAEGYKAIAAANPGRCVLIDADDAPDVVHAAVRSAVRARLGLLP